jgi:hypothetical protein
MRLALTVIALALSVVPAFAQGSFEIQRPARTWQQPGEFQQPMGPWQQPREFQQPSSNWQMPGPIQTPRWLASHTTHARGYDRRSTAVGDARFDVDKSDLRFGTEEVLRGRPDREAQYRDKRQRRSQADIAR